MSATGPTDPPAAPQEQLHFSCTARFRVAALPIAHAETPRISAPQRAAPTASALRVRAQMKPTVTAVTGTGVITVVREATKETGWGALLDGLFKGHTRDSLRAGPRLQTTGGG